jgi:hypothetical protein
MKPRYEQIEVAIMLDSNEDAFMVNSEKFGTIYFLRLDDKKILSERGKWSEVMRGKWKKNTGACIECGYAVIYQDPSGPFHLDAIFEAQSQFKQKLIRFRRWWSGGDIWEEVK